HRIVLQQLGDSRQRLGLTVQAVQRIRLPVERGVGAREVGVCQLAKLIDGPCPLPALDRSLSALVCSLHPRLRAPLALACRLLTIARGLLAVTRGLLTLAAASLDCLLGLDPRHT